MFRKYINLLKLKDKFLKERFSVGLDIGTAAIKLIKLKFSKDSVELCGFVFEPAVLDLESALKKVAGVSDTKKINLSVYGSSTVIRYVNFPQMTPAELKQALKFEAAKYIPFPIDEINLDGCILKEGLPENKMLVMLAATKKESVNQRLKLIEDAGLKPNLIDIDAIALINAFNFNHSRNEFPEEKSIALLNIGALMSNLSILEGGIPVLSRDIYVAGNSFTQKLKETFNLDFNRAEELKLNPPKEEVEKIPFALESVVANLANEVRTSFDYYESQSASTVSKIFLSGGGSKFVRLKEMLVNLLGIEVDFWDTFKKINISSEAGDLDRIKSLSGSLAVAVGLALRQ